MTFHLARIGYVSALHVEPSRGELGAMLSAWRRFNAGRAVTGFFVYDRGAAFQLIEGFPDVVEATFETIARDPRHRVARRIAEPIEERSFGDWSMGRAPISRELATGPLRPLLDPGFRYSDCDEAMGRALVAAFTSERWRRSIR